MSCVAKADLLIALQAITVRVLAWKKGEQAKVQAKAMETIIEKVKAAETAGQTKCVIRVDFGTDGKIGSKLLQDCGKKCKTVAVCLISANVGEDKVGIFAGAPKGVDVDCKAWCAAAALGLEGNGGGRPAQCSWTVVGVSNIDGAFEKAGAF